MTCEHCKTLRNSLRDVEGLITKFHRDFDLEFPSTRSFGSLSERIRQAAIFHREILKERDEARLQYSGLQLSLKSTYNLIEARLPEIPRFGPLDVKIEKIINQVKSLEEERQADLDIDRDEDV